MCTRCKTFGSYPTGFSSYIRLIWPDSKNYYPTTKFLQPYMMSQCGKGRHVSCPLRPFSLTKPETVVLLSCRMSMLVTIRKPSAASATWLRLQSIFLCCLSNVLGSKIQALDVVAAKNQTYFCPYIRSL